MAKYETDTTEGFTFPAGHYDSAKIISVERKEIPGGYIVYEWGFDTVTHSGKIGLFSSAMGDLLRVLGCKEEKPNKFVWDSNDVIGKVVSFTVVHTIDKKGKTRVGIEEIVLVDGEVEWDRNL